MITNFELPIQTRLFREGGNVSQELSPTNSQYRRWINIYKYKEVHNPFEKIQTSDWLYQVYEYEVDKIIVENKYDIGPNNLKNQKRYYAKTEEELKELLYSLDIDLSKFTYPWKCEGPL